MILTLLACASAPLVDPSLWSTVGADEDPFDDRPDDVDCPGSAWAVEASPEPLLEVDTGTCDYLALSQPSLADAVGTVEVVLRHGELTADEPATAHAAVLLGGLTLLDVHVDIPSDDDEHVAALELSESVPEGTPVFVHLHNHGDNSWQIVSVEASP